MRSQSRFTLAILLLATTPATGQESGEPGSATRESQAERAPIFGRILDPDNQPMADAEIHLVSNLIPGSPELGGNDVLRVVSNERGRFRAKLLKGRGYSAWAWATHKNGSSLSSPVADDVRPGPALDLHLHHAASRPQLILKPGKGGVRYGKIQYRLGGKHFVQHPLVGIEGDKPLIPRLAGDMTTLLYQDEQGHPLREQRLSLNAIAEGSPFVVTPTVREGIRLRVSDGKNPLGDVRILLTLNQATSKITTTDAEGTATFPMEGYLHTKTTNFRSARELLLIKEGYLPTLVRPEGKKNGQPQVPVCSIVMRASKRLEGRLLDAQGKGRARVPLALFCYAERVRTKGKRGSTSLSYPLLSHTDPEGRFKIAGFGNMAAHRLMALPANGELPLLVSSSAAPMTSDLLLEDLRPKDFIRADILVKSAEGRGLADANLVLGEAGSSSADRLGLYVPFWLFPDRRGSASVLYRIGLRPAFAAGWQGGIAELAPKVADVKQGPLEIELKIPRLITLRGRLTHPDLDGFRGATIRTYISKRNRNSFRVTNGLRTIPPQPVAPDGSFLARVLPGSKVMFQCSYTDPTDKDRKHYYSSNQYAVYEESSSDIQLELKVRAGGVKRQGIQIGIGGMWGGAALRR